MKKQEIIGKPVSYHIYLDFLKKIIYNLNKTMLEVTMGGITDPYDGALKNSVFETSTDIIKTNNIDNNPLIKSNILQSITLEGTLSDALGNITTPNINASNSVNDQLNPTPFKNNKVENIDNKSFDSAGASGIPGFTVGG